MQVDVMFLET